MIHRFVLLPVVLSLTLLSACTSTGKHAGIQHEEFGATGVFTRSFPGSEKTACESARRALLSQGYVISDWKPSVLKGRRKYQPDADVHAEIEFNVVCVADSKGSNSTTVFANAIRDRYSLKKSNTSASIGVSAIGSVSLPFGSTDDALVKVASETIPTGQFYEQFFELLERYLDSVPYMPDTEEDKKTVTAPASTPATQAATPVTTPETVVKQSDD
ncbi:DUF2242 domain-containing protein [Undibacterium sp. Ji50W]|uniref:DUF2242 domain-containing protein n=1 Tax=Undibacterium sp. Ji50W TaxID=3413041 RepID=UPI003BF3C4C3